MSAPVKLSPQQRKVVSYAVYYGAIDSRTAAMALYVMDLPKRISELERMGFKFKRVKVGKVTNYSVEEAPAWI